MGPGLLPGSCQVKTGVSSLLVEGSRGLSMKICLWPWVHLLFYWFHWLPPPRRCSDRWHLTLSGWRGRCSPSPSPKVGRLGLELIGVSAAWSHRLFLRSIPLTLGRGLSSWALRRWGSLLRTPVCLPWRPETIYLYTIKKRWREPRIISPTG